MSAAFDQQSTQIIISMKLSLSSAHRMCCVWWGLSSIQIICSGHTGGFVLSVNLCDVNTSRSDTGLHENEAVLMEFKDEPPAGRKEVKLRRNEGERQRDVIHSSTSCILYVEVKKRKRRFVFTR